MLAQQGEAIGKIGEYGVPGAVVAMLVLTLWGYRFLRRIIRDLAADNEECKRENRECKWRQTILVKIIESRIPDAVPDNFWAPPPWVSKGEDREPSRARRRRRPA